MILYFVHVPRTGGTSVGCWIKNNENFKTEYNGHSTLGWKPKYTFEQLVDEMIANDFKLAEKEKILK